MSARLRKSCPQKRGIVGKHRLASVWLRSMSANRCAWSKQPGSMSSYVTGVVGTASASGPTAVRSPRSGEQVSS